MNKSVSYKIIQLFIDARIKPRLDYTTPRNNDPFTTEYALEVENQYVRYVYAGLGNIIKPTKRVSMDKCLEYLLWLKTSAERFMRVYPYYDYDKPSRKNDWLHDKAIGESIEMFQKCFVNEFKYEVDIIE